ncbi:MAG: glycosyltransferase family 4 protein [Terrimicrobiaceae bacterium]|nr:glycosyltransferase family 4 protein [Terrimicrobiaceae bacterium]
MKIGLVRRGHSATGGAEAYLLRFAAEAARIGHEPVLITTSDWPRGRWPHPGLIQIPGRTPAEFASAFAKTSAGCDVVMSLERVPGCDVFRAGDGVHAAWLERRGEFESWWRRAVRRWNPKHGQILRLEREVFNPAQTGWIIANSRMVSDEIARFSPFPADRIQVVYNGFQPFEKWPDRAESRRALGLGDEFCVLFVGSGWERKGLATAMAAIEMTEDACLLVAGRGPADLYRSEKAKFLGPVSDLPRIFAAADVFVLPTWYDPFSNACLEALAAGLPVVTTQANGCAEILTPGVHGSVVDPGDALAIAEQLDFWKKRAAGAGPACRELAAGFSIQRNVTETLAVLERAKSA